MDVIKEKVINFIKSYVSLIAALLICIVYIVIDLIVFSVESNPKIVIPKAIIYLVISTTITALLRRQGIIYGNMDKDVVLTKDEYNKTIDDTDTSSLDDFCEYKNDVRKIQLIKRKLRSAKLNYEKYENGEYEVITKDDRKKYSKRQIKAIKYCNNLEVELYNADYLTKDIESEKNNRYHNISQQKYLTSKSVQSVCVGFVTSFVFAYLIVSLASDISWANLFYSLIKVITWLASGVMALVGAYVFVTQTYKAVLRDKTLKLKEYIKWNNEQSMRKDEQSNKTND